MIDEYWFCRRPDYHGSWFRGSVYDGFEVYHDVGETSESVETFTVGYTLTPPIWLREDVCTED